MSELVESQLKANKNDLVSLEDATAVVTILYERRNRDVLSVDEEGKVREYELILQVGVSIKDAEGKANIIVAGFVPKEQLHNYMRMAECAFMPFCFDECCISLSECIGHGLPVVTNEYAGFEKNVIIRAENSGNLLGSFSKTNSFVQKTQLSRIPSEPCTRKSYDLLIPDNFAYF